MPQDEMVRKAKNCAFGLIKWRPRTKQELFTELLKRGHDRAAAVQALDDLYSYGMINDEQLAKNLSRRRLENNKWGKRKIKQELVFRGVPQEVSDSVLDEITEKMELDIALQLAQKRNIDQDDSSFSKLIGFLYRKGFSASVIRNVSKYMREIEQLHKLDS